MLTQILCLEASYLILKAQTTMQGQPKEWAWMDCNLTLKRASKKNQNQVFEILQSQYIVQLQEDESEVQLNIEINMEKRINYEQKEGFTWHKSWNIPSIEIKISKRDLNAIKSQLGINRVYCEISSGYPIRKLVEFYLQEVALEGETRKEIGSNGIARFSNLKFSETSFNHERNKFSLILIIFTKNEERARSVIKSFISVPIYVDSRKEARKVLPKNNLLAELFPIDAFQEQLEQRHIDKKAKPRSKSKIEPDSRGSGKYLIKYSLAGFISYYKSANIRKKVKHPFYFSYHFHPLLTIYYNREMADSPLTALRLLEKPSKHERKILMIALTPAAGEEDEEGLEELKKQFQNLFQTWKYYFMDVVIKGSLFFNFLVQEKVGKENESEAERKWVEVTPEMIVQSYTEYYNEVQARDNEERRNNLESESPMNPAQNEAENGNRYEHFQLHQTICVQSAFKNEGPYKKVKVEHDEQQPS